VAHYRHELRLRDDLLGRSPDRPAYRSERAWAALSLATALASRADAEPRAAERAAWLAESQRLLRSVKRTDGKVSVPAGSEPGFVALFDTLTSRFAGR